MAVDSRTRDATLSGLDALELAARTRTESPGRRIWLATWPKVTAIGLALLIWQIVVWTGWRPDYLLPGPGPVFARLAEDVATGDFWSAVATTMRRALVGFAIATVVGFLLGVAVARSRVLRSA